MPLIDHPTGNDRFLPGIARYSCGVVSSPGFEIVHVTFQRPIAYREGFETIAEYLAAEGRPQTALCEREAKRGQAVRFLCFQPAREPEKETCPACHLFMPNDEFCGAGV